MNLKQMHLALPFLCVFVLSAHAYRRAFTATYTHEREIKRERGRGKREREVQLHEVCSRFDKRKRTEGKGKSSRLLPSSAQQLSLSLSYRSRA